MLFRSFLYKKDASMEVIRTHPEKKKKTIQTPKKRKEECNSK